METKLTLKKDFFSSKYTLYSNNESIGGLNDKSFSQTVIGEFRGKKYIFISKGFLAPPTVIIDKEKDERIV
ncbi:hypothetical protein APR41_12390 [Salegentibacter salinarum]|uniref:Uncharacterized protein n=1 Tax=Salegentibacter salinarum TaxID=447422 RepID=A0A2N0U1F8_9FLAO|nr:hypothetical protein [Salegentibacter salinarum]PKD20835.1 hypothetical protein APR41_12390 [Salegentibacter salinarum]SKB78347.1 hypothetical protein SAMN05660903_02524 [Salegentibacter salinarum]